MAKDNTNYSKLGLGRKKPIRKEDVAAKDVDKIVEIIHEETKPTKTTKPKSTASTKSKSTTTKVTKPAAEKEKSKRITLDIPVWLHRKIRNKAYDLEIPLKKYFLLLAERDIEDYDG